jgi:hypothetical protein
MNSEKHTVDAELDSLQREAFRIGRIQKNGLVRDKMLRIGSAALRAGPNESQG